MIRIRQSLEDLLKGISSLPSTWEDDHSREVIALLETIPETESDLRSVIAARMTSHPDAALTAVRLALDLSKDEFNAAAKSVLASAGFQWRDLRRNPAAVAALLDELEVIPAFRQTITRPVTWRSVLVERLKSGRGSAIKGHRRGRALEDFVEQIVRSVFGDRFSARCRFVGATGTRTEKADFAIPSESDPQILIEVKAYGATGSKQTDILGDMRRIVGQKRNDTVLILVTDGATWHARTSDLAKLVEMQNLGEIARIYTMSTGELLRSDLASFKTSSGM